LLNFIAIIVEGFETVSSKIEVENFWLTKSWGGCMAGWMLNQFPRLLMAIKYFAGCLGWPLVELMEGWKMA
jgi:hypothetical protein